MCCLKRRKRERGLFHLTEENFFFIINNGGKGKIYFSKEYLQKRYLQIWKNMVV